MNGKFLEQLQEGTAERAIGPSTLRRQGARGVVQAARNYLKTIDLSALAKLSDEDGFKDFLNSHTNQLADSFPEGARGNWGAARKALNIFFRDCAYNKYLSQEYRLEPVKSLLEVPLDAHSTSGISKHRSKEAKKPLLRWRGVKALTEDVNTAYQEAALSLAKEFSVDRVDLDYFFWRSPDEKEVISVV